MEYNKFKSQFGSWAESFKPFIESGEMDQIYQRLKEESGQGKVICPSSFNTFRAFKECPMSSVKVIIMGMEPYHQYNRKDKIYTADGLTFSCSITNKPQPSLDKLYEAIENDLYNGLDLHHEKVNDLSYLAEQGVLLINTSLTVLANEKQTHEGLWNPFIEYLIGNILNNIDRELIYMFMGRDAQYFDQFVVPFRHTILECEHPAAAKYAERPMIHKNIFSICNKFLQNSRQNKIEWLKMVKDEVKQGV